MALEVDNATKQMRVLRDGKLIRRIPVSLGKRSTPTSSGKMVIMEKHQYTTFDTRGEPNGGYVVNVEDAQRLTWGGEFIHGAPWSVSDQGHRNVSHGCTNISAANADWLMGVTRVGDLVTFTGTEVRLQRGQRLDGLEHQLGPVRQGQRAARTRGSSAGLGVGAARPCGRRWLPTPVPPPPEAEPAGARRALAPARRPYPPGHDVRADDGSRPKPPTYRRRLVATVNLTFIVRE